MKRLQASRVIAVLAFVTATVAPELVRAQSPQQFDDNATRYMALGDSIAAGYRAMPVTQAYSYLLYQGSVMDRVPHTHL